MGSSQSTLRNFCTSFIWTIKNITKILNELPIAKCLNYNFSASPDEEDLKWKLELHPFGDKEENKKFVSMFLSLDQSYKLSVEANIKFTVMNAQNIQTSFTKTTENLKFTSKVNIVGIPQFLEHTIILDKSSKLVTQKDELNILCELNILYYKNNPDAHEITRKTLFDKIVLDYSDMLADYKRSDVTLYAGGLQFKAHELILASRSSVFAGMFSSNMLEKETRYVQISDMDSDTLKEMLTFIYCGHSERIKEMAPTLLKAAAKYILTDLKEICAYTLGENLTVETAANTLILADMYGERELKDKTMAYIKENSAQVVNSKGWTELLKMPELMNEVCILLAAQVQ